MSTPTFYFYSISIYKKANRTIFDSDLSRGGLLSELIKAHPRHKGWQQTIWTIGNVQSINEENIYFRLGRISTRQFPDFDEKKEFVEKEVEYAPYSHCILSLPLQIVAISYNSNLSNNSKSLGNGLERLLNEGLGNYEKFDRIEVNLIPDPAEFITKIKSAYAVSRFWVKIGRPNRLDVEKDLIEPFKNFTDKMNGEESKVEIAGEDLDRNNLENISKSQAIAGSDGGAYIEREKGMKKEYIKLKKNFLQHTTDFEGRLSEIKHLIEMIEYYYNKVLGRNNSENGS